MTLDYGQFLLFLLVFTRMSGALLMNPFFTRRSVPVIAKVGLSLLLAIVTAPTLTGAAPAFPTQLSFMLALLREMLLGYALGLVMNLFLSWVLMAGEVMDMEMGTSVSKIYDPQSGVSMPLTGTALNILITLIFFATDGHLTLIRILATSLQMFPPGPAMVSFEVGRHIALLMGDILVLTLKLAMPVMAIELLTEAGQGILMRISPQINIFVVGIQLKIGIGIAVVILALPAMTRLIDATLSEMFIQLQKSLTMLLQG